MAKTSIDKNTIKVTVTSNLNSKLLYWLISDLYENNFPIILLIFFILVGVWELTKYCI